MEVSKNDWKLFRTCIGDWQEAYMERLVKEYVDLLDGAENASDKFWKLEERIKKDKKHPGVMLELSKGNMMFDLVKVGVKVITKLTILLSALAVLLAKDELLSKAVALSRLIVSISDVVDSYRL